jgi:N-acetylneuraminic acid mutarotase
VYVVGGDCSGSLWSNQFLVYDPSLNTWSSLPPFPDGRAWPSAVWGPDDRLYVVGGWNDQSFLASGYVFDPVTSTWSPMPSLPRAEYQQEAAVIGDSMVVLGGCAGGGGSRLCPTRRGFSLQLDPSNSG